jgi:hypothetical protein
MYAPYEFFKQLAVGSTIVSVGDSQGEAYQWVGVDKQGNFVVWEVDPDLYENTIQIRAFDPDYFTGHCWSFLDEDGYVIPSTEIPIRALR